MSVTEPISRHLRYLSTFSKKSYTEFYEFHQKVYWPLLRHIWTRVVGTYGAIFTSHKVLKPVLLAARSKAAGLLGLRVRIPLGTCISFSCESFVFSGRGPCDDPMNCPEESYRVSCVWVWSRNLRKETPWPKRAAKQRTKNKMHRNFLPNAIHN